MKQNRALMFIAVLLAVSFLYSCIYFFIPLQEMTKTCIFKVNTESGEMCVLNLALLIMSLYMFLPFITALFLQKFVYKEPLKNIGINFKWSWWYLFALLVPVVIALAAVGAATMFPGVSIVTDGSGLVEKYIDVMSKEQVAEMQRQLNQYPPLTMFLMGMGQTVAAAVTINAVFAFGEEAGWRGFLINALKDKGFIKASLIIGFVWGVWHFPVVIQGYNYPETPVVGVFLMILWCMLYAPFFSYVYFRTGSVFPAVIMHGAINASAGYSFVYLKGGTDIMTGLMGMPGILVLVVANIMLLAYDAFIAKEKIIIPGAN